MNTPRLRSVKGRDRIRLAIVLARSGRLRELACADGEVELLILCRGARNAVERNRLRRRVREAVRWLLGQPLQMETELGGRVIVIEAKRHLLGLDGDLLRRKMLSTISTI